jgi:hypothetical protein
MKSATSISQRKFSIDALSRYWPGKAELILRLPIPIVDPNIIDTLPPKMVEVELPEWANSFGVDGILIVPAGMSIPGEGFLWQRIDWLSVVFWYLNGNVERTFENKNGPIHSNSFHLKDWDTRIWSRAWVNRIALFLRRWTARRSNQSENELFGPLPPAEIVLTHDVDAVEKTLSIRLKQVVFFCYISLRHLVRSRFRKSLKSALQAFRFLFSNDNYCCFDQIMELEEKYALKSHFNFYGGAIKKRRNFYEYLFDPSYDIAEPSLKNYLKKLREGGWKVGLHPSWGAWRDAGKMAEEKKYLETALGEPIESCRQHWLRFSWADTWKSQESIGIKQDTTLGFNDRPGFRSSAAISFHPWNPQNEKSMAINVLPLVFMDSHFYNYNDLDDKERIEQIDYWIDEIKKVHGTASITWHQRVMSKDYNWGAGYKHILSSFRV